MVVWCWSFIGRCAWGCDGAECGLILPVFVDAQISGGGSQSTRYGLDDIANEDAANRGEGIRRDLVPEVHEQPMNA